MIATTYLNDQPTNMIFDTGAAETSLNRASAARLGLKLSRTPRYQQGVGGVQAVYEFNAHSYRIGRLSGQNFSLLASNLGLLERNPPIDGLLGDDFLAAYDVDLDIRHAKATLYRRVSGDCGTPTTVLDGDLYAVPMEAGLDRDDHLPRILVHVGGKSLTAIVDSGASGTAIFRDAARRIGLDIDTLTNDPAFRVRGVGPEATRAVRHVMAPIGVGDLTVQHMPVAILDQHSLLGADMLLGLDFLARVHAWYSFSSRTMILQLPP